MPSAAPGARRCGSVRSRKRARRQSHQSADNRKFVWRRRPETRTCVDEARLPPEPARAQHAASRKSRTPCHGGALVEARVLDRRADQQGPVRPGNHVAVRAAMSCARASGPGQARRTSWPRTGFTGSGGSPPARRRPTSYPPRHHGPACNHRALGRRFQPTAHPIALCTFNARASTIFGFPWRMRAQLQARSISCDYETEGMFGDDSRPRPARRRSGEARTSRAPALSSGRAPDASRVFTSSGGSQVNGRLLRKAPLRACR